MLDLLEKDRLIESAFIHSLYVDLLQGLRRKRHEGGGDGTVFSAAAAAAAAAASSSSSASSSSASLSMAGKAITTGDDEEEVDEARRRGRGGGRGGGRRTKVVIGVESGAVPNVGEKLVTYTAMVQVRTHEGESGERVNGWMDEWPAPLWCR